MESLGAYELEIRGGLNQLTYLQDGSSPGEFEPIPFVIGSFSLKNDITGSLSYKFNIERDNIFLNLMEFSLITRTDNFRLEFGPFLGTGSGFDALDMGVLGNLELTLPGIIFFSFSGAATIGSQIDFFSGNSRESYGAALGFWLPSTVITLGAESKNYTRLLDDPVQDSQIRYQLSANFHKKASVLSFRFDAGYLALSRKYLGIPDLIDEIDVYFAGFEINYNVSLPARIIFGAEIPFNLEDNDFSLFKAFVGFSYTFF